MARNHIYFLSRSGNFVVSLGESVASWIVVKWSVQSQWETYHLGRVIFHGSHGQKSTLNPYHCHSLSSIIYHIYSPHGEVQNWLYPKKGVWENPSVDDDWGYPPAIKHGNGKWSVGDFPIKPSIDMGFSSAMFDETWGSLYFRKPPYSNTRCLIAAWSPMPAHIFSNILAGQS